MRFGAAAPTGSKVSNALHIIHVISKEMVLRLRQVKTIQVKKYVPAIS